MRSLFIDIRLTVEKTKERSGFTLSAILKKLEIQRSWYYRQLEPEPVLDRRFNAFSITAEEWIVVNSKHNNPRMNHREMAYSMMDEDIAYLSPSSVYKILKDHNLIISWKSSIWNSKRPDKPLIPDEIWQTDIMYVKVLKRFYYLLIFIDVYSRYIVHHKLMISMDGDSVSMEAQKGIEKLRKDSLEEPIIQSDNGSAFISMEFKIVLKVNNLTHKRIRPHTPKDNAIVERVNKTVREEIETVLITDYEEAVESIDQTIEWYNNTMRHSSLNYLPPKEYYRGEPEVLLAVREAKLEMGKKIRRENNMENKKRGEITGIVS